MKFRHLCIAAFLLTCALFIVSLLIPVEYLPVNSRNDKEHHVLFFVFITLAARLCMPVPALLSIIAVTLFAALAELSQFLVAYRSANWLDMQANLIGIGIASVFIITYEVFNKWKKSKLSPP